MTLQCTYITNRTLRGPLLRRHRVHLRIRRGRTEILPADFPNPARTYLSRLRTESDSDETGAGRIPSSFAACDLRLLEARSGLGIHTGAGRDSGFRSRFLDCERQRAVG